MLPLVMLLPPAATAGTGVRAAPAPATVGPSSPCAAAKLAAAARSTDMPSLVRSGNSAR